MRTGPSIWESISTQANSTTSSLGSRSTPMINLTSLLREILALLKNDGQLLVKLRNTHDVQTFLTAISQSSAGNGRTASHISLDELNGRLAQSGYRLKGAAAELHAMDEASRGVLRKAIGATGLARNVDESLTRLLVRDYVLSVARSGR